MGSKTSIVSNNLTTDKTETGIFEGTINSETLAASKTLTITDYVIQHLDPNGADRDVTFPAEASAINLMFLILNTANGAGEDLVIKNDAAATIATLGPGMTGIFSCDSTNWKWENDVGVFYDNVSERVGIGVVAPDYPFDIRAGDYSTRTGLYVGPIGNTDEQRYIRIGGQYGGIVSYAEFAYSHANALEITVGAPSAASSGADFIVNTYIASTAYERFRILANGCAGIGTPTPAGILHSILSALQPALFGGDTVETIADASTTAAAATLTKAGENFLTTCAAGDLVIVTDSATGADEGIYRVVSVDLDTQLTVDRVFAGSNTNVDFYVVKDAILIGATDGTNGQRIMNYSHQNKPLQIGGDTLEATTGLTSEDVTIAGILNVDKSTGHVGIGTTNPDRLLHAEQISALTNTVQQIARLSHITSETPAIGIGLCLEFEQETSADNNEVIATIEAITTNVGAGTEVGDLVFKTMMAGAAATEGARVEGDNTFKTSGGMKVNTTVVNAATYDLLVTDYIVHITYTPTGAVTVTLPTAQAISGRGIIIKDGGNNAGTNNITIVTEGAEKVEFGDSVVINANGDSVDLYSEGTDWFIK